MSAVARIVVGMETATLTLTDFLLARIAEDEAACLGSFGPPSMDDLAPYRSDYDEMLVGPRRFLAECEAKRRIVREHTQGHCECRAVRALAAIYTDHPDHRDNWKP